MFQAQESRHGLSPPIHGAIPDFRWKTAASPRRVAVLLSLVPGPCDPAHTATLRAETGRQRTHVTAHSPTDGTDSQIALLQTLGVHIHSNPSVCGLLYCMQRHFSEMEAIFALPFWKL
jgi:hypothetical protein